ncbi:hypothetical protein DFQ27_006065 [Actinomortierella ambigua]|uniref:Lipoprotein n=1 Tax=Actinomortierella ambigua TaxID=1343610 RepID=A0A9P6PYU4_9FUNG|nr:hypothetical protein DFQ27_006065 [Actinomortierella ambigua]
MLVRSFAILCATASLAMAACSLKYIYADGTTSIREVQADECYTVPAGRPRDVDTVLVVGLNGYGSVETYGKRGCRDLLETGQTPLKVTKPQIYSAYILSCP